MYIKGNKKYKDEIISWRYEGIYSFYNIEESKSDLVYESDLYIELDENKKVKGFFCIGLDAQIPLDYGVYDDETYLDIGFGLRPDLTGIGKGKSFVESILRYLENKYNVRKFRLTVASFNKRAINLYLKIGFIEVSKVYFEMIEEDFIIMILEN